MPREKRLAEPLNAFAMGNTELAVDPVSPSTLKTIAAQRQVLEDVGAARVMGACCGPSAARWRLPMQTSTWTAESNRSF